jgi:hypothetical protein
MKEIEKRLKVAKQVDRWEHQLKKETYDQGWLKKMAREMDIELNADLL